MFLISRIQIGYVCNISNFAIKKVLKLNGPIEPRLDELTIPVLILHYKHYHCLISSRTFYKKIKKTT